MVIHIKRFGTILTSRPEGREAALVLLSSELRKIPPLIELNFDGVDVLTPSWLSEFQLTLQEAGVKKINFSACSNASVVESIHFASLEPSQVRVAKTRLKTSKTSTSSKDRTRKRKSMSKA